MEKPKIAVFGDLILDKYDYCENRDNPESSAPCHRVKNTKFLPGGAGNVAANLKSLGAEVVLFGILGKDENGECLIRELNNLGINHKLIFNGEIKTIVKQRILSNSDGRCHCRLDFGDSDHEIEKIKSLSYQIAKELKNSVKNDFSSCIISDYGKGFITQELIEIIQELNSLVYVDPKNNSLEYKNIELIKPNRKELQHLAQGQNQEEKVRNLGKKFNTNILLTLGEQGMYYLDKDGKSLEFPANKVEVADVTGSGDTVISTLVFYRTIGKSIEESIKLANKAASINVQHVGCYHVKRAEIEQ